MTSPWIASLLAIFAWWFATGAILVAVRRADRLGRHGMTTFMGLPLLAFGIWAVAASLHDASVFGVYVGFAGALAIWGWIELAFLSGVITGPMRDDCPPGLAGRDRFFRAFSTVAYHELALTVGREKRREVFLRKIETDVAIEIAVGGIAREERRAGGAGEVCQAVAHAEGLVPRPRRRDGTRRIERQPDASDREGDHGDQELRVFRGAAA